MQLCFPTIQTVQFALTSALIPESVQMAPAQWAKLDDDSIVVVPNESLARKQLSELKKIGVTTSRKPVDFQQIVCWHQIFSPSKQELDQVDDRTEVLFDFADSRALPTVVSELLRLGNDRVSFRYFDDDGQDQTETSRALLRVIGPPYYTLLRALEHESISNENVRAFVQIKPRVWAEAGYTHPMAARLEPPAGQWLMIDAANQWNFINERPFRDIYELLSFKLPQQATTLSEYTPSERISVPLKLTPGVSRDVAELWVVAENALSEIEALVCRSDDRLISQLAFAVTGDSSNPTVLIRTRPSRLSPPALVLKATAFRSYLKIPNLFLPIDQRLHPPLRREAIVKLLVPDSDCIHWLLPQDDGGFVPQSVPDLVFRPMEDWIEYVLDNQHEPLEAWIESHRFDFEPFVCSEAKPSPPKPKKADKPETKGPFELAESPKTPPVKVKPGAVKKPAKFDAASSLLENTKKREPSALQKQLRQLETEFFESEETLDSPQRIDQFKSMAIVNSQLGHRTDSTICWSNALWNETQPGEIDLQQWTQCEKNVAVEFARKHPVGNDQLSRSDLDCLLGESSDFPSNPGLVASHIIQASFQENVSPELRQRLGSLTQYMLKQENYLPIRTAWMAWHAMYRMSGNDVLLLARSRDRLLERLFQHGLKPEFDLAGFMRSGVGTGDRFRVLRDQVATLQQRIDNWIVEPQTGLRPQTKSYASLIFAYVMARLGESTKSDQLRDDGIKAIKKRDSIHAWVIKAYGYRIKQALSGQPLTSGLEKPLLDAAAAMEAFDRYKIDKLRQQSRILEPHERVDPYRRWHGRHTDQLSQSLMVLDDIMDRDQLRKVINKLMNQKRSVADQVRVLSRVLELAPRLEEKFALDLLDRAPAAIDKCEDATVKTLVLQRAIYVAAHFGQLDAVHEFVKVFSASLPQIVSDYLQVQTQYNPEEQEKIDTIESLFTQSFRGMRKLGMRDEIGRLFAEVAACVKASEPKSQKKRTGQNSKTDGDPARAQRLLLCVAGGWYYFGQFDQARIVVDSVRDMLFDGKLAPVNQKNLACAYIHAVSQAPVQEAMQRIQEVFDVDKNGVRRVPNVKDILTTSSHFSISQLNVVEATAMSLVSDDFSISAGGRRWLDEDEFLVRARIHRDMREAVGT